MTYNDWGKQTKEENIIYFIYSFKETVKILLNAGGKFQRETCNKPYEINTPLHTAVELQSEATLEMILQAGALATAWNKQGLTAMHLCVKKRNKELLQVIWVKYSKHWVLVQNF